MRPTRLATWLMLLLCSAPLLAQWKAVPPSELLAALQRGGQVIVMRHASSPREVPDGAAERVLDEAGRASARAMGDALRSFRIPVGKVLSSPTLRARETVELARLPVPVTNELLGDGGSSMHGVTPEQGKWLQAQVAQLPTRTNTLIVTHLPNIGAAFPQQASELADGEALVFGSDGKGGAQLLARVKIDDWARLGQ